MSQELPTHGTARHIRLELEKVHFVKWLVDRTAQLMRPRSAFFYTTPDAAQGETTHSAHYPDLQLQDVPSFLQEVTTVRGQIAYAAPALRSARGMPNTVSEIDEIELSQMERYMSLSEMAALGTVPRAASKVSCEAPLLDNCTCGSHHFTPCSWLSLAVTLPDHSHHSKAVWATTWPSSTRQGSTGCHVL